MKTKFTLLIAAGLFIAAGTMAQDRSYQNDHRDNNYANDFRYERHGDFGYKEHMYNLQQRLMREMDELDRARECGDWDKVQHERREIAEIRNEMHEIKHRRWFRHDDNEVYRNHDYNSRF